MLILLVLEIKLWLSSLLITSCFMVNVISMINLVGFYN